MKHVLDYLYNILWNISSSSLLWTISS